MQTEQDFAQDKVRQNLKRLIDERGIDMASVSIAIGRNHAYIQQFLSRGVPKELGYKAAAALAEFFETDIATFGIETNKTPTRISNDHTKERHPIESIRRITGLDINDFARALNVNPDEVTAIERGRLPISEALLFKICQTFKIDPNDLFDYAAALSADERVTLLRMRQLTPEQKQELDSMIHRFTAEQA